ncbi:MAG: hypothetical protein A3F73_02130 [Gallionellales bacterium RIFCSPLOWO2_12_FULL_59_22]|nr:MAG: hypothetical protein A3H99_01400 [Gallionellales bacterium RIFCSPLOWO2_02_FULL_59_110]OGT01351.1 MAG: hypothetical protein A2Z65_07985 [Gallionellales bacterium RIFCSPLOWO2_02_58_13]OGT10840.1 MAG: hypothetical protein A3F73_02130 [Gallionellales bacterium RIFCSPLOWO2_12_FULL_59_22]
MFMESVSSKRDESHHPVRRLLFILVASVFTAEAGLMFLLHELPPMSPLAAAFLDAAMLTILLFPVFHFLVYLPMARNISKLKQSEEELRLAATVFQNSSEAMMVTDADARIACINPAFTEITGYRPEEVIGKPPKILSSGQHDEPFYQAMWHAINTIGHWQGEIWNRRKSGEIYAEWLSINSIFGESGAIHRIVAIFSDITRKKEAEKVIWQQAHLDALTELPNRRLFFDRLQQAIKKTNRTGMPLALLFIDLDRFKEVNDILGHATGDALLKEAAIRLSGCVRDTDTVARLGGDEFTVIMEEIDNSDSVERVANNIKQKLSAPFALSGETVHISASTGIVLYPADAATAEDLLINADRAMYLAKESGRNRFIYFGK